LPSFTVESQVSITENNDDNSIEQENSPFEIEDVVKTVDEQEKILSEIEDVVKIVNDNEKVMQIEESWRMPINLSEI
jgi:predicted Zn-ribbon and HTH transcriptional regulator